MIVATCGLVYELLAATLGSYLLGDSVTQFSLVIGLYLSAMGVGAWLSGFIQERLPERFIDVELGVALVGGLSVPVLFFSFARMNTFLPALLGVTFAIGILVGLELPLLMRILRENVRFEKLVSRALTFDYLGALVASLLFPILLVPRLGLVRTALLTGVINAAVALWGTWALPGLSKRSAWAARVRAVLVMVLLGAGTLSADRLTLWAEQDVYSNPIVHAKTSKFQRIVVTGDSRGFQLFLNGNLQFASADEYRYHEALVHPAMGLRPDARRALVLGGGDGLAIRELLKHRDIEEVVLVELDPAMSQLAREFPPLRSLNRQALDDPRVRVVNDDAMVWLAEAPPAQFDVAIVDFPDPSNYSVGKLYTTRFYNLLKARIAPGGVVAIQSTSPLLARSAFWCVVETLRAAGLYTHPYHVSVPSFGEWGFVLATRQPMPAPQRVLSGLRFLNDEMLTGLFALPNDMGPLPVSPNRLNDQVLVRYYEREWNEWD